MRRTSFGIALDVALLVVFAWLAGCNPFFFLPPFHEGPHRIQPTTVADIERGDNVAACLQIWARNSGANPDAMYYDVDFTKLVIVRVGGDGVIGTDGKTTWQTDARENGDTIFINEGVSASEFVGLERHELVHLVQSYHPELEGPVHQLHYAPPFNACQVPLAVFSN